MFSPHLKRYSIEDQDISDERTMLANRFYYSSNMNEFMETPKGMDSNLNDQEIQDDDLNKVLKSESKNLLAFNMARTNKVTLRHSQDYNYNDNEHYNDEGNNGFMQKSAVYLNHPDNIQEININYDMSFQRVDDRKPQLYEGGIDKLLNQSDSSPSALSDTQKDVNLSFQFPLSPNISFSTPYLNYNHNEIQIDENTDLQYGIEETKEDQQLNRSSDRIIDGATFTIDYDEIYSRYIESNGVDLTLSKEMTEQDSIIFMSEEQEGPYCSKLDRNDPHNAFDVQYLKEYALLGSISRYKRDSLNFKKGIIGHEVIIDNRFDQEYAKQFGEDVLLLRIKRFVLMFLTYLSDSSISNLPALEILIRNNNPRRYQKHGRNMDEQKGEY